jgi:hypothetical protein
VVNKEELVGFPIPIRVEVAVEVTNETVFQPLAFNDVEFTWKAATRELSIQSPTIFNMYFDAKEDDAPPFRFRISDTLVLLMNPPSFCTSVDLETGKVHQLVNALVLTGDDDVPIPIRRTSTVRAMHISPAAPSNDEATISDSLHSVNPKKRQRASQKNPLDAEDEALVPPAKIEKKKDAPCLPNHIRIYTINQDGTKTLVDSNDVKVTCDAKGAFSIQAPVKFDIYNDGDETFTFKVGSAMTTTLKKGGKCLGVDSVNNFVAYSGGSSVMRFGYNDDDSPPPVTSGVSITNRNGNVSIQSGFGRSNVQINRF